MNKERIRQLADYLEALDPEKFYMGSFFSHKTKSLFSPDFRGMSVDRFMHECGTTACIAGQAIALFAPGTSVIPTRTFAFRNGAEALGFNIDNDVEYSQAHDLFYGRTSSVITNKLAAMVLRHLAETEQVDWDIVDQVMVPDQP